MLPWMGKPWCETDCRAKLEQQNCQHNTQLKKLLRPSGRS